MGFVTFLIGFRSLAQNHFLQKKRRLMSTTPNDANANPNAAPSSPPLYYSETSPTTDSSDDHGATLFVLF